jgi:hypothetical protein
LWTISVLYGHHTQRVARINCNPLKFQISFRERRRAREKAIREPRKSVSGHLFFSTYLSPGDHVTIKFCSHLGNFSAIHSSYNPQYVSCSWLVGRKEREGEGVARPRGGEQKGLPFLKGEATSILKSTIPVTSILGYDKYLTGMRLPASAHPFHPPSSFYVAPPFSFASLLRTALTCAVYQN